jgi:hypothetical protein
MKQRPKSNSIISRLQPSNDTSALSPPLTRGLHRALLCLRVSAQVDADNERPLFDLRCFRFGSIVSVRVFEKRTLAGISVEGGCLGLHPAKSCNSPASGNVRYWDSDKGNDRRQTHDLKVNIKVVVLKVCQCQGHQGYGLPYKW